MTATKMWEERDQDGGVVTNSAGVKVAAEDVGMKVTIPRCVADQLDKSGRILKQRARRRFRQRPVVVRRRFKAADQKTSTKGQDICRGVVAPGASDTGALPDSREPTIAPLPKDHVRRSATGLKARVLYKRLMGALVTALLLSAVHHRPEPITGHPVEPVRDDMAPSTETWVEVYLRIQGRNAAD